MKKLIDPKNIKEKVAKYFVYLFIVALSALVLPGIYKYFSIKEDNVIEEYVEDQIELFIGEVIDLSPKTREDL